jgi:hypothetical protein
VRGLPALKKTFIKYDGPQQNWNLYGKWWPVISQRHNFLMKHLNAVAKMLNSKSEIKLQNEPPYSLNGSDPTKLRRFKIRRRKLRIPAYGLKIFRTRY